MLKAMKRRRLSKRLHQVFKRDSVESSFCFLGLYLKRRVKK